MVPRERAAPPRRSSSRSARSAGARRSCSRRAAADGVEVVAIDPHAGNDRGPQEIDGTAAEGEADHDAFLANLAAGGVADRVRHVRMPSQEALGAVAGEVDLLYVDGAHRYGPARADLDRWGARVRPGGAMLVHDAFSSVGVTLALLRGCLFSRSLRYVGRDGSLAEYRREPGGLSQRAAPARAAALVRAQPRDQGARAGAAAAAGAGARARRDAPWPY